MENLENINEVIDNEVDTEIVDSVEEVTVDNGVIGKAAAVVGGAVGLTAGIYFGVKKGIPAIKRWNQERQINKLRKKGFTIEEPIEIIDVEDEYPIEESE